MIRVPRMVKKKKKKRNGKKKERSCTLIVQQPSMFYIFLSSIYISILLLQNSTFCLTSIYILPYSYEILYSTLLLLNSIFYLTLTKVNEKCNNLLPQSLMKQHRQATSQSKRIKTKRKITSIMLLLYTPLSFTRRLTFQKTFAKRGISRFEYHGEPSIFHSVFFLVQSNIFSSSIYILPYFYESQ